MFRVCHAFLSVHCSLVVTCWERASLLALMCVFYCVLVTFPRGVLGQVWYLIVPNSNLCLLTYFVLPFDFLIMVCPFCLYIIVWCNIDSVTCGIFKEHIVSPESILHLHISAFLSHDIILKHPATEQGRISEIDICTDVICVF